MVLSYLPKVLSVLRNPYSLGTTLKILTVDIQTQNQKNLEDEILKLESDLVNKHKEDWNGMTLKFEKQTENIDKLSDQYLRFYQEYNGKLRRLNTEYKRKLEVEKEHLVEVSEQNRQCCICWEKMCCKDSKPLLCGHEFHANCINQWLRRGKSTCPYCRADCTRTERCKLWQYGLWSFQTGCIKLERFLPKNQHTQRKFLNFENWTNGEPQ